MKKEMRELYIEGVANHDGPEPCVDAREGSGEALGGVRAGRLYPRNKEFRVSTRWIFVEGNIVGGGIRESLADPARSENQGMCGVFMRGTGMSHARPRR